MQLFSAPVSSLEQLNTWLAQLDIGSYSALLIQIFSSQPKNLVEQYYRTLTTRWNDAVVIGSSAQLTLSGAQVTAGGSVISLSVFQHTSLSPHSFKLSQDYPQDGVALYNEAISADTQVLVTLVDGLNISDTAFFNAFNQSDSLTAIAGGVAAPLSESGESWLMFNGIFQKNAVAVVALNSQRLRCWRNCYVEWFPIGRKFVVGKVQGRRVYLINNKPAYEYYCQYLSDGLFLPFSELQGFPLMLPEEAGSQIATPLFLYQDGSIEFSEAIPAGTEIQFCYSHPALTQERIEHGAALLEGKKPEGIFIYNCAERTCLNTGNPEIELQPFANIAPTMGFYSHGELYADDKHYIAHHSLTYLALSEVKEQSQLARTNKVTARAGNALTPLFRLIRNTVEELNQLNRSLETQVEEKTHQLLESVLTDRLTGLPNHVALHERLANDNHVTQVGVIKLSDFSNINQLFGHSAGDFVLVALSEQLRGFCKASLAYQAQVYRIGTSVWALTVCGAIGSEHLFELIRAQILEIERKGFSIGAERSLGMIHVSLTAGMAERNDLSGERPVEEEFILRAYEARRAAKQGNRVVCRYTHVKPESKQIAQRMSALKQVHVALFNDQVRMYGHNLYYAGSRTIRSTECLVRIVKDDKIILPNDFLPTIQHTPLYSRLSRRVIEQSFALMDGKNQAYSINLAPQDLLNDHTMQVLLDGLSELKHPELAGFEIVETEQISDYVRFKEAIREIRRYGACLYVDDFGSGYSNIDEVLQLEPQVIKLDGSLIKNIDNNKRQRMIVAHLNQLCHSLGIQTVAEYVHSEAVCLILEELGIDFLQGFYLSKPQPLY